jgi:hypothetical protein
MKKLLIGCLLVSAMALRADLIEVTTTDRPDSGNPGDETTWVSGYLGPVTFIGKIGDNNQIDEDPFNLLANGDIIRVSGGVGDDTVSLQWDLTGTGWILTAVLLKGGQGDTLYETTPDQILTSNGVQTIEVTGDQRDIGHISFFGREDPGVTVPDASTTLAFLGLAMLGLEGFRRKIKLNS